MKPTLIHLNGVEYDLLVRELPRAENTTQDKRPEDAEGRRRRSPA
ncbi:MAG: hypothetical protein U1G07_21905 [Verrucomicrobiota bacterium]